MSKKGDSFGGDIIEKRGFSSFLGVKKERKNEISNDMKIPKKKYRKCTVKLHSSGATPWGQYFSGAAPWGSIF